MVRPASPAPRPRRNLDADPGLSRTQNSNQRDQATINELSRKPARAIFGTGIRRVAKTTALGGVATGIMKAAEAAMVAGA